jgi:RNA polymerase sigma factor for flagellar operon FliA
MTMTKPHEEIDTISDEKQIWIEYSKKPSPYLEDQLMKRYRPLVHKIVAGFVFKKPAILDYDDLVSAGNMGLLTAIRRYDPNNERGAKFSTFATLRVRGSILDEINSINWTPRKARQDIRGVLSSIEALNAVGNHNPSISDIAKQSNMDEETTKTVLGQMEKTYTVNIGDDTLETTQMTDAEQEETRRTLKLAMHISLNEDEEAVVVLTHLRGYSQKEVRNMLQLTETQYKQLHSSALAKLRSALGSNTDILY